MYLFDGVDGWGVEENPLKINGHNVERHSRRSFNSMMLH